MVPCRAVACPDPANLLTVMSSDDAEYRLLRLLEANPQYSQRELAQHLGLSLGKINYCLRALIDKGWVKARNFSNSPNKRAYLYVLTPKGMEEKARIAVRFLRAKMEEYEHLEREISELRREIADMRVRESEAD